MTSTMLEPFDTQMMLDYPTDIDVQMQSVMWMQYESSMDTDAHFDPDQSLADADFDVEVDMDSYNQPPHNPEYEMVDDGAGIEQEFMVDVEVLDEFPPDQNTELERHDIQSPPLPIADFELGLPADHTPIELPSESHPSFHATPSQGSDSLLPIHSETSQLTQDIAISSFEQSTEPLSENAPVNHLPIDGTSDAAPIDTLSAAPLEPLEEDLLSHENHETTVEVTSGEVIEPLGENHQSLEDGTVVRVEANAHEVAATTDEAAVVEAEAVFVSGPADVEVVSDPHADDLPKDPHEISDGVYIEPPPAVLLSFPDFDHSDVCLFNQPSFASSSSQPGQQEYSLLLEHHPTLYYESLSAVFGALREDEYLSSAVDLSTAELVLDAHDLQLVISEDNKYASEVTLHELNIIHDASDISGPLRLRLHTVSPRFVLRYRQLQDHVARLQLESDEVFYTTDEENKKNQFEESHDANEESVQEQRYEENVEQLEVAEQDQEHTSGAEGEEDGEQYLEEAPVEPSVQPESIKELEEQPEDQVDDQHSEQKCDEGQSAADEPAAATHNEYEDDADGDYDYGAPEEEDFAADSVQETLSRLVTPRPFEVTLPPESKDEEHIGKDDHSHTVADTSGTTAVTDIDTSENDAPSSELDKEYANSEDHQLLTTTDDPKNRSTADSRVHVQEENYDDLNNEEWGDADAEGDPDTTWEELDPEAETASNKSSVTLASRSSKRSIDEVEDADGGDLENPSSRHSSPGSKRVRVD
ncbi:uncharacterized protein BT62DRAFT_1070532 [Guyanagaster necrorhizus]|uniref:Uncharacterized protein n=1 Tax=Guyanagaster necrorhizus TaxID=856835 RepID=A0A9P7W627_9AGAR|nr:uncharacterized protein BT62DRAFT_1070532 [Guyanagaster necrorhizus MCA 3950]KAG7452813.1 hypothetical protein BT62DRAFT_1070532 [Guyanagaster necrorhizus MCA 3950]